MSRDDLKRRIETAKLAVTDKYAICRVAAKRLREAHGEMRGADEKLGTRFGARAKNVYAAAENEFNTALKEFSSFVARYDALVDEVMALYDEIAADDSRGAHKIYAEAEKFESQQSFQRERLFESVSGIEGVVRDKNEQKDRTPWQKNEPKHKDMPIDEPHEGEYYVNKAPRAYAHSAREGAPQFYRAPEPQYYPHHTEVSVMPMSIDISNIVEDAVAAAMEKFKRAFDKRADRYIDSIEPTPCKEIRENGENVEASGENDGKDALSDVISKVSSISSDMQALASQYEALASSKEDAFAAMQKVNDIQRSTARELQGALAKQKVMSQDQAALSTEQAALAERLKANLENHKLLLDVAAEISDMQKTISEAQEALKTSMQELLASQKALIATHQSIIAANQKAASTSQDITERQAELNRIQRNVMAEHKHLFKKYKPSTKESDQTESE